MTMESPKSPDRVFQRASSTYEFYEPHLRSQRSLRRAQQLGVERSQADKTVEIVKDVQTHDAIEKANKMGTLDSSRRKSISLEEDSDRTAVDSNMHSIANSMYHLSLKFDSENGSKEEKREKEKREEGSVQAEPQAVEPYHVFSSAKKRQLLWIVSLAGLFSPLSSNIYFPALGRIATDLHVSAAAINLTITVYMIVQAIAPSFWGPFSDSIGRRPIFVATLLVYLASNIGLATSNNYIGLMVFRGIQAAGSAATISIGAGVIGDMATASERGGMIGVFGGIRMMGQALGPVVGGLVTQIVGYRGIFWFLLLLGSIALFSIIFLLPETLRPIAGNGTTRLVGFQRPLIYHFKPQPNVLREQDLNAPKRKVTIGAMLSPLKFLMEKDVFTTLVFGSIIYTFWSMVTSSTTTLFQSKFGINDFQVGLAFLPNGFGCVVGSTLTGRLMDYDFKRTEKEYRQSNNIPDDVKLNSRELEDFPVERARMRNIWWIVLTFIATIIAYGYSFRFNHIAAPLVLQFFIAYTATAVFSLNSALVIDLYPGKSASATAVNNLMRCSVGAAGVAVVEPILDALGVEMTFLALGLITVSFAPLLGIEWVFGMKWRNARSLRLKGKENKKTELMAEKGKVKDLERKVEELDRRLKEMEHRSMSIY